MLKRVLWIFKLTHPLGSCLLGQRVCCARILGKIGTPVPFVRRFRCLLHACSWRLSCFRRYSCLPTLTHKLTVFCMPSPGWRTEAAPRNSSSRTQAVTFLELPTGVAMVIVGTPAVEWCSDWIRQ